MQDQIDAINNRLNALQGQFDALYSMVEGMSERHHQAHDNLRNDMGDIRRELAYEIDRVRDSVSSLERQSARY